MTFNINEYCKKVQNVKFRKIPRCKYEYNDPKEKHYWKNLLDQVEKLAQKRARGKRITHMDLWAPLPPKLHARVSKLIKIPLDIEQDEMDLPNFDDRSEPKDDKKPTYFNESTLSEVLEGERNFREIKLKIDPKPETRTKPIAKVNWIANYMQKKQKDRIVWKSKLYKLEKDILEKPLFEQAEEIMDRAAENFADWLNSLAETEDGYMSKETIKQLFSIELAEGASAATHIEPKEINAVPEEIAKKWNLKEMSLEHQVEQHFKTHKVKSSKKPITVAFGKTIPVSEREWVPSGIEKEMQPVFPEELRTNETLFRGITHLRSTKALVQHYLENNNLRRPQYLVEIGTFQPQIKEEYAEQIPLYDRLKKMKF